MGGAHTHTQEQRMESQGQDGEARTISLCETRGMPTISPCGTMRPTSIQQKRGEENAKQGIKTNT